MTPPPTLELGFVSRAHGLRGEVAIRTFDPASEALDVVERVLLHTRSGAVREVRIEDVRPTPKENIVVIEGVDSRTEAESLVGAKVFVYREDLEPPGEGEFFQGDLVGLIAVDESGVELGRVEEIWSTGEVPNIVIRAPNRPELVVPFADEFVPSVDLATQRIVIRPPEYVEVGRPGGGPSAVKATPEGGEVGPPEVPDDKGGGDSE